MKITQKIMVLVVLLVIVFSLVGCDDPTGDNGVTFQQDAFVQDAQTAFDDSGLDTVAGEIDNLLVGGMTGIDYTK